MKYSAFLCSYNARYKRGDTTLQIVDQAIADGFTAIEPFPCDDLHTVEQAQYLGGYVRDRGLSVSCYSTCITLIGPGSEDAETQVRSYIDQAAAMGSPYFHFTIAPELTLPATGSMGFSEALKLAVPKLTNLCAYAADRGVTCAFEDQGFYFNGSANFERFCDAMGDNPFGVVVDVGNIQFVDENIESFIGSVSGRICHVHLKDYLRKPGSAPCPGAGWFLTRRGDYLRDTICGHGVVNFPAVFRLLAERGYDGWYSLEYCDEMEPGAVGIPRSLQNLSRYYDDARRSREQSMLPAVGAVSK